MVAKPLLGGFDQAFQYIQEFTGFFTPGICVIFLLGMFWKRCTTTGALVAAIASVFLSTLFKLAWPSLPFMDRVGIVFLACLVIAVGPIDVIKVGNIVGEGILWDSRRQVLWWTDIQGRKLHRYDWSSGSIQILDAPERIGSFGLVAHSDELIAAFASGIALYHPQRQSVTWLARPAALEPGIRFNDGRVDRRGRFWCGTMVEGERPSLSGCLYSMETGAGLRSHLEGVRISNGLCMSPDGVLLYFADSPTRTIGAYELLEPEGNLGRHRIFAQTPEGAFPDGATIDADGCMWSAHWGAGVVVRYTPEGRIDRTVKVPTCQPSCVCFAGPDLDVLCVTSARENLNVSTLAAEPNAGDVFLYRAGVQGLPEPEYRP
jgi:L-arabinonolactonase